MTNTTRVCLSLPADLVDEFDRFFGERGIRNRSQAFELVARDYLSHAKLPHSHNMTGILTIVSPENDHPLGVRLQRVFHNYRHLVTAIHQTFQDDERQDTLFVQGSGKDIQKLCDVLLAIKGIRLGRSLLARTPRPVRS